MIKFATKRHRHINAQSGGVTAWKMLRKPDGSRIPFEEVRSFRIFDWVADEADKLLTIDSIAVGTAFKGNKRISQINKLYLYDLSVINIYDHSAEFFSKSSIDLWYMENDNSFVSVSSIEQLSMNNWVKDTPDIVRARWVAPDEDFDRISEELCIGRKVVEVVDESRNFDMDFEDL